jgi:hypothetical protein
LFCTPIYGIFFPRRNYKVRAIGIHHFQFHHAFIFIVSESMLILIWCRGKPWSLTPLSSKRALVLDQLIMVLYTFNQ